VARDDGFVGDALDLFHELRTDGAALRKKPATAELLGWIMVLRELAPEADNPLAEDSSNARTALSSLIKTRDDQNRARTIVDEWIKKHQK
jgi:hypothetical protein